VNEYNRRRLFPEEGNMEPRLLDGRIAVVTGASRGLGSAVAVDLARHGAFVCVNYLRNHRDAEKTLARIREAGGDGEIYEGDVRQADVVQTMFQAILKKHKRVDVLVNNAGITRDEYFVMMRPQSWQDLIDVHLNATFFCTKAVIRSMCAARRGVILNIGSGSSLVAMPGQVNYSASKAGLLGFSRSLAREVAERGVRVLHVAPGFFETDMTAALDPRFVESTFKATPIGRWGHPDELASVVTYLASDDAAFLTGHTIVVDGGRGAVETEFGFYADAGE
jgi:3-oxoacyl-[acyl-carrier protein] reductase